MKTILFKKKKKNNIKALSENYGLKQANAYIVSVCLCVYVHIYNKYVQRAPPYIIFIIFLIKMRRERERVNPMLYILYISICALMYIE